MLMATKKPDFFHVAREHDAIDRRLENWAQWCAIRRPAWISPMFRMARSNSRQWHAPEIRPTCNTLDANLIELAVRLLPGPQRAALRWCYVYRYRAERFCKQHGLGEATAMRLIYDGRQILTNKV